MRYSSGPTWLDDIVLTSTVIRAGRASEFYRAARAGRFRRVAEGVFLPTPVWGGLTADDRYLALVHATALASRPGLVFSHHSAAALWGLPIIGRWPARPEVSVGVDATGHTRRAFTARKYEIPSRLDIIDGLRVTPLARTVVDMGRTTQLSVSVAMMDRALAEKAEGAPGLGSARIDEAELVAEFATIDSPRGRARCRLAIELADGASGSPGESLSRVGMHLLALPAPRLQQPFYDAQGLIGKTDFWWPEFNLIGEFDGLGKYRREDLLDGQSPADAVIAEKKREDRLRACGPRVVRWGWDVARSLPRLARHLADAGLA
jgi:hypothetical protein